MFTLQFIQWQNYSYKIARKIILWLGVPTDCRTILKNHGIRKVENRCSRDYQGPCTQPLMTDLPFSSSSPVPMLTSSVPCASVEGLWEPDLRHHGLGSPGLHSVLTMWMQTYITLSLWTSAFFLWKWVWSSHIIQLAHSLPTVPSPVSCPLTNSQGEVYTDLQGIIFHHKGRVLRCLQNQGILLLSWRINSQASPLQ